MTPNQAQIVAAFLGEKYAAEFGDEQGLIFFDTETTYRVLDDDQAVCRVLDKLVADGYSWSLHQRGGEYEIRATKPQYIALSSRGPARIDAVCTLLEEMT